MTTAGCFSIHRFPIAGAGNAATIRHDQNMTAARRSGLDQALLNRIRAGLRSPTAKICQLSAVGDVRRRLDFEQRNGTSLEGCLSLARPGGHCVPETSRWMERPTAAFDGHYHQRGEPSAERQRRGVADPRSAGWASLVAGNFSAPPAAAVFLQLSPRAYGLTDDSWNVAIGAAQTTAIGRDMPSPSASADEKREATTARQRRNRRAAAHQRRRRLTTGARQCLLAHHDGGAQRTSGTSADLMRAAFEP